MIIIAIITAVIGFFVSLFLRRKDRQGTAQSAEQASSVTTSETAASAERAEPSDKVLP